ncbi:IGFBP N-terminal domain-containing protein [Trichonephila clavipes]|nr:IGFBP N-terminal domain-containing protein [Trichonephila clavipes]
MIFYDIKTGLNQDKCVQRLQLVLVADCENIAKERTSSIVEICNHSSQTDQELHRIKRFYFPTDAPLHCPPCEQIHCYKTKKRRIHCKGGMTSGICGCCNVCAKLEGEECGGQHNYLGKCDKGFICEPQEPRIINFIRNGIENIYKVENGICKKGHSNTHHSQEICKPKCDPEYCIKNPRRICSAKENAETFRECQGLCQHTSCRACKFLEPDQQCRACAKDDFQCIRNFGRCIRKDACKVKDYPCGRQNFLRKLESRFQCQVPACKLQ